MMISRMIISLRKAADLERGDLSSAGHAATVAGTIEFVRPRRSPGEEQSDDALNGVREAPVNMVSELDANDLKLASATIPSGSSAPGSRHF